MKKMLYISHVDWDWIKQRPQCIAEELSNFYEMFILYSYSPKRSHMPKNSRKGLLLKPFFPMPPHIGVGIIHKIHRIYLKIHFKHIIKHYKPDYIWLTFPLLYDYLPQNIEAKIIYDCMDDSIGFTNNEKEKKRVLEIEKKLIKNSWKIFTSSKNLATQLNKRKKCSEKVTLIRNAFDGNIINTKAEDNKNKGIYKICYIGTVSSWFDFESIKHTLKKINNIEYHIIGPLKTKTDLKKEELEKIKFYGPIEHDKLYSYAKDFDCMIMPFSLNELIYSVDPVKLYEYINYNKPIISVYYDELKQFNPFVYFYSDKKQLVSLLKDMMKNDFEKKYSNEERLKFLKDNDWKNRAKNIFKQLNG